MTPAWRRILNEIARDAKAVYQLDPWQFEEFNAGAYEEEGWTEVTLTPRSADRGRDIIAIVRILTGFGSLCSRLKHYAKRTLNASPAPRASW